ncbi:hypothetical protein NDU88_002104 [Pleurodeles waltl]|uniref:Uncharacterized protein n=1 Tax=Pleurodeles waltl TaxID=8319 RepID=A0AAV7Q500_PLEWA|nr:hypothetical protein NDU88_002104 [Pleurodeles waltl]
MLRHVQQGDCYIPGKPRLRIVLFATIPAASSPALLGLSTQGPRTGHPSVAAAVAVALARRRDRRVIHPLAAYSGVESGVPSAGASLTDGGSDTLFNKPPSQQPEGERTEQSDVNAIYAGAQNPFGGSSRHAIRECTYIDVRSLRFLRR